MSDKGFKDWLLAHDWSQSEQHWNACRICRRAGDYWGWRSPKWTFYHEYCLMESSRGKQLYRQYQKDLGIG